MSECVRACVRAFVWVCLFVCLSVYVSVCLSIWLSLVSLPRALDICDPCQKPPAGWSTQVAYRWRCGGRMAHSVSASTNSCHRGPAGVTQHGADADIALAMQAVTVWPHRGHSAWGRRRHCTGHAVMQSRCGLAGVSMGPRGVSEHRVASRVSAWSRPWPALHCHAVSHGVASRGVSMAGQTPILHCHIVSHGVAPRGH